MREYTTHDQVRQIALRESEEAPSHFLLSVDPPWRAFRKVSRPEHGRVLRESFCGATTTKRRERKREREMKRIGEKERDREAGEHV